VQAAWGPAVSWHWQSEGGGIVSPLDAGSIDALIDVPEDGSYRISLRHQLDLRVALPVTLALRPQKIAGTGADTATGLAAYADAGPALEHVYGQAPLTGAQTGQEIEKNLPIRFEGETEPTAKPAKAVMVWEYWDAKLKKGVYRATLATPDKRVRAHALFLSMSKDFRPSFGTLKQNPSLGRIYMRFRVTGKTEKKGTSVTVSASLTYHGAPRGNKWNWGIGKTPATPEGEWTPFIEATDAIVSGASWWSTCELGVGGVPDGEMEVQFSWHPAGHAELTMKTALGGGRARLRVPHGSWTGFPKAGVPEWGMWSETPHQWVITQEATLDKYLAWAREAEARLGVKPDHPRTKLIRLYTGNRVLPPLRDQATEMLARLGINWIDGASPEMVRKLGLRDETALFNNWDANKVAHDMTDEAKGKLTKVKLGDEIGTSTPPAKINANPAKLAAFHAYLQEQAHLEGMDIPAFLGAQDLGNIKCLGALPANPRLFDRRLFYHSQRFCTLTTCEDYRPTVQAFERHFPNVRVYNNYSPHPLFLSGTTMNGGDWFVMCRNKAQTLAWGEDWAYYGCWSLFTAWECTSYYAALVECAARKHGYPAGFYVVCNCSASAEKIFACLAQGVTWLHLYDWGPIDGWADGRNSWSETQTEYYSILCATCALGPADEIVAKGQRERRRTAILYNRSHEMLQGGKGRMNHDWMWTFIGLKHSRIPVEVIIEEDLNPEDLKRYDCVFIGGLNLARRHVAELKRWVQAGGLLIGTCGAAGRDVYGEPLAETVALFGARQVEAGADKKNSVAQVTMPASEWFPACDWRSPDDLAFVLEPTTAKPLGAYGGGECAATVNAVGQGHALLLGFRPGLVFRDNGQSYYPKNGLREWLAAPVLKRLGRQRVELDYATAEATLFEHDSGLAVLLANFGAYGPDKAKLGSGWSFPTNGVRLSVQTDRPIREAVSALRGPVEWKKIGDRIEIKTPPPDPVDVVILR